jgi:hypothetical protein
MVNDQAPEQDFDALREAVHAELTAKYHEAMAEFERAFLGDLDQFKPRGILEVLAPRGMCEVELPAPYDGPLCAEVDTRPLEQQFAEALAELEGPVDPRVWATTPAPCAPPLPELPVVDPVTWPVVDYAAEELPPVRWSRPPWMWP